MRKIISVKILVSKIGRISDGKSLTALALWPDQIRSSAQWRLLQSRGTISILDDGEIFPTLRRSKRGDVLSALENAYQELKNDSLSLSKRRQALAFFYSLCRRYFISLYMSAAPVILVANRVDVQWLNKKVKRNLHWVWDTGLIKTPAIERSQLQQITRRYDSATTTQLAERQVFSLGTRIKGAALTGL